MGVDRVVGCWRYLVLALMLACSGSASAASETRYSWYGPAESDAAFYANSSSTLAGACALLYQAIGGQSGVVGVTLAGDRCQVDRGYLDYVILYGRSREVADPTCPANSLLVNGVCKCNTGFNDVNGQCVNNTQQKTCSDAKGGSDWFSGFKTTPTVGSSFCPSDGAAASCGTTVTGGYCTIKAGVKSCSYEVKYTGATCTPPTTTVDAPVSDPCKGSSGTVNGKTVCVPIGSDPTATTESTKSTSDTKTTTTPDGTSTTTTTGTEKTTTCTGATCTTTTTTTTTGGSGGTSGGTGTGSGTTTETKTEPKEDYCSKNPKAVECGGSSFSGSCNAAFVCEGDAIQCAIAKDQLQRNCQALDPDKDSGSITNQALSGADKLNTTEMKAAAAAAKVDVGSFDTTGRSWGRGCPADPVIPIPWAKGNSSQFTIPFSRLCSPLQLLANAAVAITLLGSLAWVVGGSKAAA